MTTAPPSSFDPPDPAAATVTAPPSGPAGSPEPAAATDTAPPPAAATAPRPHRFRRAVFARPTFGGLAGALALWWLSLSPSLLPRDWSMQAAVSAVCLSIGYLLGSALGRAVHWLLARRRTAIGGRARRWAWWGLAAVGAVVVVAGLALWTPWQNDQRALVALDDISPVVVLPMVLATLALAAVLIFIGRLVGHGIASLDRFWARRVPAPVAHIVTFGIGAVVFSLVFNDLALTNFFDWANRSFGSFDTETPPGVVQPTSPTVSGSPESLVPWDTLGYEGRNFAGNATTVDQLRAFAGLDAEVKPPIRVYTGLRSADTPEDRAALAVQELERTGAFDREVLAVVTVTGTGWVDPDAARSLEYLHNGDTAIVAQQYSYLPSWISFLVDADKAADAGEALNRAVYERWSQLPEGERPKLVVFGLSLGSYGAEAAFAGPTVTDSVAALVDRSDGALIVGPTDSNKIWTQLQRARDPDSPVWRPVYDGGTTVRFTNQPSDLDQPAPDWRDPRVLYIHHPSDPVGYFDYATLVERPDWTRAPVGYDVPTRVGWWPIVTWVQTVADLVAGFSTPAGHGHNYANAYVAGWAALVPPDGWTATDSQRLLQHLGLA